MDIHLSKDLKQSGTLVAGPDPCKGEKNPMPKVFEKNGYKFFFFANEGNPREPLHIHVRKGERRAKFWMRPVPSIAENYGFSSSELRWMAEEIKMNEERIEDAWNDFFNT